MLRPIGLFVLLVSALGSVEPSQEEVAVLQLTNRLRTAFDRTEHVVLAARRDKRITVAKTFEAFWGKALSNQKANPCALIHAPALADAARDLLASGQAAPDKSVFDAGPSVAKAGYAGAAKAAVAAFAKDAPDLEAAFAAAVTNVIGIVQVKPTYAVEHYWVDQLCQSQWREIGVAVSVTKGRYSLVMVLGAGGAERPIGGVTYTDANTNGRFDPGEARAGVAVSAGKKTTTSGKGGLWWLDVPAGVDIPVSIGIDGLQIVRPVTKEAATAQLDWRMPTAAEIKTADGLIAAATKAVADPDPEKHVVALANLLVGTRMLMLDDARAGKAAQLVAPVTDRFDGMRSAVLRALGEEPKVASKEIETQRKRWNGALTAWFKEASRLVTLRQQVNDVRAAQPVQAAKVKPLLAELDKAIDASCEQAFVDLYLTWQNDLRALDPSDPAEAAKEPKKK